ncbi:hypothetical protein ACT3CE_18835, partial [Marinifilum sp. RC60d5]|uniref:hypothetical protein n=1 Tax=Marinifilum sp. RC60d5 TaxID=3458414 RepID=UPI004036022C
YDPKDEWSNYSLEQVQFTEWYKQSSGRVEITDSPIDYMLGAGIGKALVNGGRKLAGKVVARAAVKTAEKKIAANTSLNALSQGMVPNAGGKIVSFTTKEMSKYYRVFSSNPNGGAFLTKVSPKSSSFARNGLALPKSNRASFIQEVIVPEGVTLQRSRTLGAFGKRGGLEQFQILNFEPRIKFLQGVPLK